MTHPTLGPGVEIDVQSLIESRLLVQANSGGGKSWALRRLLEQTYGACQHIVIDVEGEFHTLRETFDYVLAGKGGDCPATVASAALLARRLLELNVSAIIDIYELGVQRRHFVKAFLDAIVGAPRELWHPALIVVDEAHLFAPEKTQCISTESVVNLMTLGRKRGFCGVLATQRIAKLNKDAAADCATKLIGRTGLDIDMERAGKELGFVSKDDVRGLKFLPPGTFYGFGPGFGPLGLEVRKIAIGPVATTHPKAGQRAAAPTPPRAKVREVLARLADLPAEANAEARSVGELQSQVADLKRQLAARAAPPALALAPPLPRVAGLPLQRYADDLHGRATRLSTAAGILQSEIAELVRALDQSDPAPLSGSSQVARQSAAPAPSPRRGYPSKHVAVAYNHDADESSDPGDPRLTGPERRILEALVWLQSIGQMAPAAEAVAFLADYSPTSGSFDNTRGALRSKGLVDYPTPGTMKLTEKGAAWAPRPPAPGSGDQLRATVLTRLAGPERKLLEPLIAAYPESLSVNELAAKSGYAATSGSFDNTRGRLRTLGLAKYPQRGLVRAADLLFPDGAR